MNDRKKTMYSTALCAWLPLIMGALFALNAIGEEVKPPIPRPRPSYNGSGGSWHSCEMERIWRLEDDRYSYTDKEIAELQKHAEAGDVETMFLLSQIIKKKPEDKQDTELRRYWLDKAKSGGHPLARYYIAIGELQEGKISQQEYLELAETAAKEYDGYGIAYRLGLGYFAPRAAPTFFDFLPADPAKALYWMRLAAERGHIAAADQLCSAYFYGNTHFGIAKDYVEARKWCLMAVPASCSTSSSLVLSQLHENGLGVPRNLLEARYWNRIWETRFQPMKQ